MSKHFKKPLIGAAISAVIALGGVSTTAYAQQAGGIKGNVTSEASGTVAAGVTVTATSNVMPRARTVTTKADGSFNLPALIPGIYELTFTDASGTVQKAQVEVRLDQTSAVNMVLVTDSTTEVISIVGSALVREGNSSLTNSLGQEAIRNLPVGQEYRDLMKLIPGVQYSESAVLGPSAGGSGRDNKYSFDGVDVSLPMFGNLSSEPSTHDIASVSIDRGGAKAIGFNRSGGFAINTTSKSGTNEFHGNLEYKIQSKEFTSDVDDVLGVEKAESDQSWLVASVSGPLIQDELFFYGSVYRPDEERSNKETAYGPAKDLKKEREEYFGKLTWAPTDELMLEASMRTSDKDETGLSVGDLDADSTSQGAFSNQDIITFDGTYLISDVTTLTFKYSEFELETRGGPDTLFDSIQPRIGDSLPLGNLGQIGQFAVPTIRDDVAGYDNVTAQMLIDQYGYTDAGGKVGGGSIGGYHELNDQNFYRDSFELSVDHEMDIGDATHYLHFGFQWKEGIEILSRSSNGWGSIGYVGGLPLENFESDVPVYYTASVQQMSLVDDSGSVVPAIESSYETYNLEIHDTIESGNFTYDIGFLLSKDVLYGQGLKENSANVSGYELAPGHKYKMHTIDWKDMIQPRLGITWNYDGDDKVFANFASYNPEASSLSRAASWARNTRKSINVYFDQQGNYLGNVPASGSSGKFFQEGMDPRRTDEYTVGLEKAVSNDLLVRGHVRHRKAMHHWEDTWNGSRLYGDYTSPFGGVPAHIAELGLYIPNLDAYRDEVGGSSYVIAELDGGLNKYWEVSLEAEYFGDRTYLNASYVWSNYYGNYDQDITSGSSDGNLFIGSSNLADGKGRQLWDGKYGKLNGNKPHILKVYGYYTTDWEANIGAYLLYQSGDVWEAWDGQAYGYSSSTIRYAEPAGSRREPSHWQLDLNYTQTFDISNDLTLDFRADIFNVFDNQTGWNYDPYVSNDTFGTPRNLINPRRLQLSFNIQF